MLAFEEGAKRLEVLFLEFLGAMFASFILIFWCILLAGANRILI